MARRDDDKQGVTADDRRMGELNLELKALMLEATKLRDRKEALGKELEEIEQRQRELSGGFRGFGEIKSKRAEIKTLELEIADKQKPRVIWTDGTTSDEQIVDKVTPKRIFVRTIGRERADQYVRATGERVGGWSGAKKIDLQAMEITPE